MRDEVSGMSTSERNGTRLVRPHNKEGLSQRDPPDRLGIQQFKRQVEEWRRAGDAVMVSRQRGRPSNDRLAAGRRAEIAAF